MPENTLAPTKAVAALDGRQGVFNRAFSGAGPQP